MHVKENSPAQTLLVRRLVRLSGLHEPAAFSAVVLPGGDTVMVRNGTCGSYYPAAGWTSRFMRHLHAGFYGTVRAPRPAPFSAGFAATAPTAGRPTP